MQKKSTITFCGGAGSVTGANFLFHVGKKKILIDCGMSQGHAQSTTNQQMFLYDPRDIDVLLVTHAHADHIGKIPKLVRDGFRGVIYSTPATRDLSAVMLDDALTILTRESKELGLPLLYEQKDIRRAMQLWKTVDYHDSFDVGDDVNVTFFDAGHILGSAMIVCERNGRKITFTGDLGNSPELLLCDTEKIHDMNYVLMESVYGNRNHEERSERTEKLKRVIIENYHRGGTLLIPTFALQRAQVLLYEINKLVEHHIVPEMPVFFDAPLAQRVTDIFRSYKHLYNQRVQDEIRYGDDIFDFPQFVSVESVAQSRNIKNTKGSKIIIASSGMSNGGRIRLHEKKILGNKRNTILFIGYQAFGTLGRRIQEQKKGKVYIDGKNVRIRASVQSIQGYSGHKDHDHLVEFMHDTVPSVEKVFVTMGEIQSSQFLAEKLKEIYKINAIVPQKDDVETILF